MAFASVAYSNGPYLSAENASPNPAPSGTFSFTFVSPFGASYMRVINLQPSTTGTPGSYDHSCHIQYDVVNNWLYLQADTGGQMIGYGVPGHSAPNWGSMSNSQCSVSLAGSSYTTSGNTVTLTVPLTFTPAYYGALHLWAYGQDTAWAGYWNYFQTWTAGPAPAPAVTITAPSPTTGPQANYFTTTTDNAGASDILWTQAAIWGAGCQLLFYGAERQQMYLLNDAQNGWIGPVGVNGSGGLQNSTCQVRSPSYTQTAYTQNWGYTVNILPTVPPGNYTAAVIAANLAGTYSNGGWLNGPGALTLPPPQVDSTVTLLTPDLGVMGFDDYSGTVGLAPTPENPYVPEAYITQPTTTDSQPMAVGQSYTVVITGAPANSTVWARSTSSELNAVYNAWNPATAIIIPLAGAAAVGTTDANGYFSATWPVQAIQGAGDTTTGFWVGAGNAADPNYPPGVASQVNPATFCGQVWFYARNPDGSVGPDWTPAAASRRVRVNNKTIKLPVSPAVKVNKAPSSTFEVDSKGVYTYHFSIDTKDPKGKVLRIGADAEMGEHPTAENQSGWYSFGLGWIAGEKAERASDVALSLRSSWKPGPVPVYWGNGTAGSFPMQESSAENVIVSRQASIFRTSTQRVVIGPAIKPGLSQADLRLLVRDWKDTLGFSFLDPLLNSSDWAAGLDALKPATDLERSVIDCLRNLK
jgi:hypothetical protein